MERVWDFFFGTWRRIAGTVIVLLVIWSIIDGTLYASIYNAIVEMLPSVATLALVLYGLSLMVRSIFPKRKK